MRKKLLDCSRMTTKFSKINTSVISKKLNADIGPPFRWSSATSARPGVPSFHHFINTSAPTCTHQMIEVEHDVDSFLTGYVPHPTILVFRVLFTDLAEIHLTAEERYQSFNVFLLRLSKSDKRIPIPVHGEAPFTLNETSGPMEVFNSNVHTLYYSSNNCGIKI